MSAAVFAYRAVDRAGVNHSGVTEAADRSEAYYRLQALGLTPLSLDPARTSVLTGRTQGGSSARRVKLKDLANFTSQMAVLVGARLPIGEGLLGIAEQEPTPHMRTLIRDLASQIESGRSLADAMDAHRATFGEIYIETIRAAEKTGNLTRVLEHLADMLESRQETQRMVRAALTYPTLVLSVMGVGVTFLVGFVVPKFARMFQSRGVKLPALTQVMYAIGQSVQSWWFVYLGIVVAFAFTWWRLHDRPWFRAAADSFLARVPLVSGIAQGLALARFSRVMGLSLSSGLGLIDAIDLGGKASGHSLLTRDCDKLIHQVRSGGRLSDILTTCPAFTPFAKRMLRAGETSAQLPAMCSLIARHYDREATHNTKQLTTLIEPIMIVVIALVVLLVALSVFLPMWDMVNLIK